MRSSMVGLAFVAMAIIAAGPGAAHAGDEAASPAPGARPVVDRLEGTWKSLDDPRSGLAFAEGSKTDTYDGEAVATEKIGVFDSCDGDAPAEPATGQYLLETETGMCWFLISVAEETLELSYVGRGNTLRYRRVGQP